MGWNLIRIYAYNHICMFKQSKVLVEPRKGANRNAGLKDFRPVKQGTFMLDRGAGSAYLGLKIMGKMIILDSWGAQSFSDKLNFTRCLFPPPMFCVKELAKRYTFWRRWQCPGKLCHDDIVLGMANGDNSSGSSLVRFWNHQVKVT